MSSKNQFDWVPFYQELANKLLLYKDDRRQLVENVKRIYEITGINMPTLERNKNLVDIDPFTVFGLFNKTSMREDNRVKIIQAVAELFSVFTPIPTSFDSIPLLNPQNATYYLFLPDRGDTDMDELWGLFDASLKYAQDKTSDNKDEVSKFFDLAINLKENGNSKITMGLYWIASDAFLNLDSRNEWYIYKSGKIPEEVVRTLPTVETKIPAVKYFEIAEKLKRYLKSDASNLKDFRELSYEAWVYSEKVNQEKAALSNKKSEVSNAQFLRWFKPLLTALRDLGGSATPTQAREKIIENERLTQQEISETRGKNNTNKFENDVAWARNYLVDAGYIDKSKRGVWTLTELGKTGEMNDEIATNILKNYGGKDSGVIGQLSLVDMLADDDIKTTNYWLYSPGSNAKHWDEFFSAGIMAIGWEEIGDLSGFTSKEEIAQKLQETDGSNGSHKNDALAMWQFVHDVKPGDIIFAKKGRQQIIGCGVVESDYSYDASREYYRNVRYVKWTRREEHTFSKTMAMKTLTDITQYQDDVNKLKAMFKEDISDSGATDMGEIWEGERSLAEKTNDKYDKTDFLHEVFMSEENYDKMAGVLENKKNIILQGAPGVGKTYAARRLAYSIMGEIDKDRVKFVQFHQNYTYEDFVMGHKPTEDGGFQLKKGIFYQFCKMAERHPEKKYFFLIDEINRGNMSKIFGELLMLIETEYRGTEKVALAYNDELFSVPENLYIIGMMNTADRSLAMIDYALRRRFSFFEMDPAFDSEGFKSYQEKLDNVTFDRLIDKVKELNKKIANDASLGKGFRIGHSYFSNWEECTDEKMCTVVDYDIIPMLEEYWFDDNKTLQDWINNLHGVFQ